MGIRAPRPIAIVDIMHREASRTHARTALGFVLAFVLATVCAARFGDVALPAVRPFIPICATLWGVGDLLTAFLLFTQFGVNGIRAFAVLGAAYLIPGLLTPAYIVLFPRIFVDSTHATGFEQVSVWLWVVWHIGFAVIVGVYHLIDQRLDARVETAHAIRQTMLVATGAAVALCAFATIAVLAGHATLLPIVVMGHVTRLFAVLVAPLIFVTNVGAAFIILNSSKRPSTLQLWLMVALAIAALDGLLNAFSVGRYTVNWYVGKVETLCSATVVLMILLAEVSLLYRRLGTMATIDVLTQVANRRSFDDDANWALNVRARHPLSLAFLVIDVDHFKLFNDTYGHHAGDLCLRRIADAIRRNCARAGDLIGRYGGEEFVVLLLGATPEGAAIVAEAIRAGVEESRIPHSASPKAPVVTVSVGGIHATADAAVDLDALFRAADAALYRAKLTRNSVDMLAMQAPVVAS